MSEGGTAWEQGEAVSRMVTAMQHGDADVMAQAMADYAASLGTRVTSSMSAIAGPLLDEMRGMRQDRAIDAKIADHKLDLLMTLVEHEQAILGNFDARLSLIEANTLSTVISQVEREQLIDLARTIPELAARVAALEAARDVDG